jgi:tetratricopeptide (TPR) repeat protein
LFKNLHRLKTILALIDSSVVGEIEYPLIEVFMDKILQKWLWKPLSRIIGLLLLILLPTNLWNAKQDKMVMSRQELLPNDFKELPFRRSYPELDRLQEEGKEAYYAADYPTALEKFEHGLKKARELGDKGYISQFIGSIGVVYGDLGQYPKALAYYQQALAIEREIKDRRGEGGYLSNIGVVYGNLGQYNQALEYFQQALAIHREIKNPRGVGKILSNIGVVYGNLGQYQKALAYYQQALEIRREIQDRRGEGADLTNIGVEYRNLGQYNQALEYYQQALQIKREIQDRRGEGGDLSNIGVVYDNLGQYQKALAYYQQALEIRREIQDRRGEGTDLTNIGVVYKNLGQYNQALAYYQQALQIKREIQDQRGVGNNLTNIGVVYGNLGQYNQALEYFQQALAIDREIKNPRGEGAYLTNLGAVYDNLGQYSLALEYYQQALAIDREIKDRRGEGADLTNIGVEYKNLGDYQKAKEAFQESLAIHIAIETGETWTTQRGLASTEAKLNQPEPAIKHYEQALDNIEKLRAGITEKEHKTSFMQDKLFVYDELIALLQSLHQKQPEKGYDRKAIEIFERKQGRIFLEEMGKSSAWRFAGVPNKISQRDRKFEQQIAMTRKNRTEALAQGKDAEPHRKRLEKLHAEQADFEKILQTDYPAYYALKYPKPVALETLQKDVLQADELLLIYNIREEITDLWIIGKHQFQMLTLDISEKALQGKVNAFRAGPDMLIEAINTEPSWEIPDLAEENLPSMRQASYDLYQQLLPAAAKTLLKDARTLYIVPTGPLYGLPFGALETHNPDEHDEPHYLIQDYPIAYLSSASLLKTIRETKRKVSERQPFLAFAHPEYPETCPLKSAEASDFIQTKRTEAYLKLAGSGENGCFTKEDELADTKVQAEEIAKQLQVSTDSDALQLRAKASRSNVFDFSDKKRLDDYQYVLFAAHAVLPNEITRINQSAIVLSNPDTEGYLTMADAFALQMNADLVMLSACNTGRGEKIKGEGVRGLTRAFMYAGTPAVSVSLWSVESRSAKELSISLFKYLQAGKPLAQALRQSKLDLMDHDYMEMYQHPYFWAPFVVFGDGGSVAD